MFVTGFRDFVFEGYRVQAVDYLVKPVDADRLSSVLSRVRRQAGAGAAEAVCLSEWGTAYTGFTRMNTVFYSEKRKWWR